MIEDRKTYPSGPILETPNQSWVLGAPGQWEKISKMILTLPNGQNMLEHLLSLEQAYFAPAKCIHGQGTLQYPMFCCQLPCLSSAQGCGGKICRAGGIKVAYLSLS